MQMTWSARFLGLVADHRGWARFSLLLDKLYSLYFRMHKQSAAALLSRKQIRKPTVICFVCKGNVCRSPFAAEYLNSIDSLWNKCIFFSAGLQTENGSLSPKEIRHCSREFGVDLSKHRGTRLIREMIEKADLIVGMEPIQHIEFLLRYFKWRKKFLLLRALEAAPESLVVPDPLFKDEETVRKSFELLVKDCHLLLDALKEIAISEDV